MSGSIVFIGIAPHPPLLVPEIGGARIGRVAESRRALQEFSRRLVATAPDSILLISPHSPLDPSAFTVRVAPRLSGDFSNFMAPQVRLSFQNDLALIDEIEFAAAQEGLKLKHLADEYPLDHGALVPLYYLEDAGWKGPVAVFGYTNLSGNRHISFGRAIRQAASRSGRQIAVVASGDLSHRLIVGGPYEYEPSAHLFDEQIVTAIAEGDLNAVINIDQSLRSRAGECGYRSILVSVGCLLGAPLHNQVLSYEGPYGVGYMVAVLEEEKAAASGG